MRPSRTGTGDRDGGFAVLLAAKALPRSGPRSVPFALLGVNARCSPRGDVFYAGWGCVRRSAWPLAMLTVLFISR